MQNYIFPLTKGNNTIFFHNKEEKKDDFHVFLLFYNYFCILNGVIPITTDNIFPFHKPTRRTSKDLIYSYYDDFLTKY